MDTHQYLLNDFTTTLRQLLAVPPMGATWRTCEDTWSRAVALVSAAVRLTTLSNDYRPRAVNPANARDIQHLYRRNCRKAVRLILDGPSTSCSIPLPVLVQHWSRTWSERMANGVRMYGGWRTVVEAYLAGSMEGDFRTASTQLRSTWTEARKASRRLSVLWELDPEATRITCDDHSFSTSNRRPGLYGLRPCGTPGAFNECNLAPGLYRPRPYPYYRYG